MTERVIWLNGLPHYVRPVLRPAAAETLQIVQEEPGVNPSQIAALRDVTPHAAHSTVAYLERLGYITTRLEPGLAHTALTRSCYPAQEETP